MNGMRCVLAGLALTVPLGAYAATGGRPDLSVRSAHYYVTYRLNANGSFVETVDVATKVLKKRALADAKQATISYSTSVQKVHVLKAYTIKADGRRIEVPKTSYQITVNHGEGANTPAYSNMASLQVVFPDLAVGDTTELRYRIVQSKPLFPDEFSVAQQFRKTAAYDDVRIVVNAPESLWARHEARGMRQKIRERDGRRIIRWTYRNRNPVRSERTDYSVYDPEHYPGYAYSTFRSYAAIAEAYGVRATPKSAVTPRIRRLAERIVKGAGASRRAQARALYDWVARHITYAGNCIGVGAVVPRNTSFILDNRMGDCKDHATLLQALLAARGIFSTQALINAGSVYRLPRIPVVSNVNHVIDYIPSMNLFLDSTSDSTPFGMLPFSDYGKPVLLVDSDLSREAHTPEPPLEANRRRTTGVARITPDGSLVEVEHVALRGAFASGARAELRGMSKDAESRYMHGLLRRSGYVGHAMLDTPDAEALRDTYHYAVHYRLKDFLELPGPGALRVGPVLSGESDIERALKAGIERAQGVDVTCAGSRIVQDYRYVFPKNVRILGLPRDISLSNRALGYRASYRRQGRIVIARRELDIKTVGSVCTPAMMRAYRTLARRALRNLRAQVVYEAAR